MGDCISKKGKVITIVSGLPRSGTSMMMKMLEAGGMELAIDNIRVADEDNPKGYFELEKVKQIKEDRSWLPEVEGKVVKMVSKHLFDLPSDICYKIIFMQRKIEEVLASQNVMLKRRGKEVPDNDSEMALLFTKHLDHVHQWLTKQTNMDVLYVSYNDILQNPEVPIKAIRNFLGGQLNVEKMCCIVDPKLYRQRK